MTVSSFDIQGYVTLRPEDDEDMWHLYNLIQNVITGLSLSYISSMRPIQGDKVRAQAIRRVQNVSSTGSTESHRVRLNLTLEVTRVTWSPSTSAGDTPHSSPDPSSSGSVPNTTASLQISGRVASENPHVKMGAFHTLDIEVNRDVRIEKGEDGWDSIALARIEECCVPGRGAEVGAVVCGEGSPSSSSPGSVTNIRMQRYRNILPSFSTYDRCGPKTRSSHTSQISNKFFCS